MLQNNLPQNKKMTHSELNAFKKRMDLFRMNRERFLTAKRNSVGIAPRLIPFRGTLYTASQFKLISDRLDAISHITALKISQPAKRTLLVSANNALTRILNTTSTLTPDQAIILDNCRDEIGEDLPKHNFLLLSEDEKDRRLNNRFKELYKRIGLLKEVFSIFQGIYSGILPQNFHMQEKIENLCFRNFSIVGNISGLQSGVLHPAIAEYWDGRYSAVKHDLILHGEYLEKGKIKNKDMVRYKDLFKRIIDTLDEVEIMNPTIYTWLSVLSNQTLEKSESTNAYYKVAIDLGKLLSRNYMSRLFINHFDEKDRQKIDYGRRNWNDFIESFKEDNLKEYNYMYNKSDNSAFYLYLGSIILNILQSHDLITTKLVKVSQLNKRIDTKVCIIKDESLLKYSKAQTIVIPQKLPMIYEPKDWGLGKDGNGYEGGYLLNGVAYSSKLLKDKPNMRQNSSIYIINKVFHMVNGIGKTSFKINSVLLQYLISEGKHLLLDKNEKHPLEFKSKNTKREKGLIESHYSKINLQETILEIALCYDSIPYMYIPVRIDQRGRLYCLADWLNYQGTELAKALILFNQPGLIARNDTTAINFLKCAGANTFGLDKKSESYKLKWIEQNENAILNYRTSELVDQAKDKYLFLAFCIEYKRFHDFINNENQDVFETYLPIQLDATTNGFQHMIMLSTEADLFDKVNLWAGPKKSLIKFSDREADDFYVFLIQSIRKEISDRLNEGVLDYKKRESYLRLDRFIFERKMFKKALMTVSYNASILSMVQYIKSELFVKGDWDEINETTWYWDGKNEEFLINSQDIFNIVSVYSNIIDNKFKKIACLRKYLSAVAKIFTKLNINIIWYPGNGMEVVQSYLTKKTRSATPFINSKSKITLQYFTDELDRRKQVDSLMPNLVHSLDATSLCLLYDAFSKSYKSHPQFYCVHDCFASTADKIENLKNLLASVYTNLYLDNQYLIEFDQNIIDTLNKCNFKVEDRKIDMKDGTFIELYDINWVLNKKELSKKDIEKIESQFILV